NPKVSGCQATTDADKNTPLPTLSRANRSDLTWLSFAVFIYIYEPDKNIPLRSLSTPNRRLPSRCHTATEGLNEASQETSTSQSLSQRSLTPHARNQLDRDRLVLSGLLDPVTRSTRLRHGLVSLDP